MEPTTKITQTSTHAAMIGRAALKLTQIAGQDLPLVIEFLDHLEQEGPVSRPLPAAELRELAKGRAALLADVPRELVAARFSELVEEIRQEAITKGTAIDGDWEGD